VEIDRCAADAIQAVTGCKLGKRTLKYKDYGKLAATFVNVDTGEAVRVAAREDARDAAWRYAPEGVSKPEGVGKPEGVSKKEAQLHAYQVMPAEELFIVTRVIVDVPACDMPGHPVSRVICDVCGEGVNDRREVIRDGLTMCIPCANGAYYVSFDAVARPSTQPVPVV
jgi:formylmethanofuran dehydrogenase subunit E